MRYFFLELLVCPVCKSRLLLHAFKVEEKPAKVDVERVRCRRWCGYLDKPADQVPLETCRKCVNLDIVEAVLVCTGCGRWYPVIDGIPRLLDDKVRKARLREDLEFIRPRLAAIPPRIRAMMKWPEIEGGGEGGPGGT